MSTRFGLVLAPLCALALLGGCSMGSLLIHEQRSPYDFDATVARIVENGKARGWEVPKAFDFQASLIARGQPDPGPLTVIKLCSPELATRMFAKDASKRVSTMAPCSISVYEKADGHTYIATINMKLMARLMGDDVGPVLAEIAREDDAILAFARASTLKPDAEPALAER